MKNLNPLGRRGLAGPLLCGLVAALSLALAAAPAEARDTQGKTLEKASSRPRENGPARTGVQKTQDSTKKRTQDALDATGSKRQQEKTVNRVNKALRK